jgi:hypothetical protein
MSIKGALTMAKFSSDRTIEEYATHIWNLSPVEIPTPSESALNRVRSQPHLFLAQDKLVERRKVITERQDSEFSMLKEEQLDEALRRGELEHELPSYAKTDGEITQDA